MPSPITEVTLTFFFKWLPFWQDNSIKQFVVWLSKMIESRAFWQHLLLGSAVSQYGLKRTFLAEYTSQNSNIPQGITQVHQTFSCTFLQGASGRMTQHTLLFEAVMFKNYCMFSVTDKSRTRSDSLAKRRLSNKEKNNKIRKIYT